MENDTDKDAIDFATLCGKKAFDDGLQITENPYYHGTNNYTAWEEAYIKAYSHEKDDSLKITLEHLAERYK